MTRELLNKFKEAAETEDKKKHSFLSAEEVEHHLFALHNQIKKEGRTRLFCARIGLSSKVIIGKLNGGGIADIDHYQNKSMESPRVMLKIGTQPHILVQCDLVSMELESSEGFWLPLYNSFSLFEEFESDDDRSRTQTILKIGEVPVHAYLHELDEQYGQV